MDTALAAYLALPAQRTYDLADLALRYLRKELRPEAGTDERPAGEGTQLALDTAGEDETWPDWCLRAQAVGELAVKLGEELAAMEVGRLVDDVELPLVPILAKLERTGIAVDLSVLDEIRDRLDARLADHEARVYQLAGEEFNIGSNPQLQQILFEKLGLPKTKRIKTGYTTDHNALVQLATTDPHPILDALIGYREVAKLKNTYVDTLPKLVDKTDGRIHAQFNQLITSTGRLSTQNPNVQNIPIRTEAGREIRRAFIADPESKGCWWPTTPRSSSGSWPTWPGTRLWWRRSWAARTCMPRWPAWSGACRPTRSTGTSGPGSRWSPTAWLPACPPTAWPRASASPTRPGR